MTDLLSSDDYVDFLAKEYLLDYVRTGGAAVKFCVGSPPTLSRLRARFRSVADDNNYLYASVDAAGTKVSMTDQVLFALTRALDLDEISQALSARAYREAGFPTPDPSGPGIDTVSSHYQMDWSELYRSVRRRLEQTLLADVGLPRDLRLALFRLAQHHLDAGDVSDAEAQAIKDWLTGRPANGRALRSSGIRYRITRGNALRILTALPGAIATSGHRGLIANLHLERLGRDRPKADRESIYYTNGARLDVYEIVRELIDSTDSLGHGLVVITIPDDLFDNPDRGPFVYPALAMRLIDDVADRHIPNPFAPVVRLA
jgi:P-loop Domain of unknown function (DUF2791)